MGSPIVGWRSLGALSPLLALVIGGLVAAVRLPASAEDPPHPDTVRRSWIRESRRLDNSSPSV